MNKAVFLDRDGVINDDTGHYYIFKPKHFKLNIDILESVKLLNSNNYKVIVITNQGGISKNEYSHTDVAKVHSKLLDLFINSGGEITDIYYCPHHSNLEACICRKPDSLMIEKAISIHNIDISKSYFIGDNERDFLAGKKAGLKSFKIKTNSSILKLCKQIVKE